MTIYVSNLSYQATEEDLSKLFSQYGAVVSTKIITDQFTGRSREFAFVEMSDDSHAKNAIKELNNTLVHQMAIGVSEARPRKDQRDRSDFSRNSNRRY